MGSDATEFMRPDPLFPDKEYDRRLTSIRQQMADHELDVMLVTVPENIFYLTGLNHQGYFALHLLIVPLEGEMQLIARAMEKVTVERHVTTAQFHGYKDSDHPVDLAYEVLEQSGLGSGSIGIERNSAALSLGFGDRLRAKLPYAHWRDISGVIDEVRLVQSPLELAYTREAAAVTQAMLSAAVEVAGAGGNERQVAAEAYRAMILTGGEFPGLHPLIRSTSRLAEEHTTWADHQLQSGEILFLEMSGCVGRYHAPAGRLIFIGDPPAGSRETARLCLEAFEAAREALQPGIEAGQVYQAWQKRLDRAGLSTYRRHHCGYIVGIGFPPSWTGGNRVVGLRADSRRVLQPGMVFHLMSWLLGTGRGDYFVSDTAVLTDSGCEVLTSYPREVQVV